MEADGYCFHIQAKYNFSKLGINCNQRFWRLLARQTKKALDSCLALVTLCSSREKALWNSQNCRSPRHLVGHLVTLTKVLSLSLWVALMMTTFKGNPSFQPWRYPKVGLQKASATFLLSWEAIPVASSRLDCQQWVPQSQASGEHLSCWGTDCDPRKVIIGNILQDSWFTCTESWK